MSDQEDNNPETQAFVDNLDNSAPDSTVRRPRIRPGKTAQDLRLPMAAFLAGGLLVAGVFVIYQLNSKPAAPTAAIPQPTPTTALIIANPDDEIIFHSTPAPVSPSAQASESAQPSQTARVMYISGQSSNVRHEPSLSSPILISLNKNVEVTDSGLRKTTDNVVWARIRLPDSRQGWISEKLLMATLSLTPTVPDEAPTPQSPQASAPVSKAVAEASIRSRALRWKMAWEKRDLSTAATLMHNQFSGEQMSKSAWLNKRRTEAAKTKSRSIEWQEVQVSLSGNNAEVSAIQHYHDVFHDNQTYDSSVRIRLGMTRWSDGNWYITRLRYAPA